MNDKEIQTKKMCKNRKVLREKKTKNKAQEKNLHLKIHQTQNKLFNK